MARPALEVADVVRRHGLEFRLAYGASLSPEQRRVMQAIEQCRTAALGGHLDACDECGHRAVSYNSCRNRHCPKCQALARAQWVEAREADLLPVGYFHVVFTLPEPIAHLALQNKRVLYNLLFSSAWESLRSIAADPKHLGAAIGALVVLHTWGQTLTHHPHVHCVVPGGGISPDGPRWVACRKRFFLPVRVLSRRFRTLFVRGLREAYEREELAFHGTVEHLAQPAAFEALLRAVGKQNWVVYAKPPFGGPRQVLKYLGRYTHRVAISNHRLVRMEDGAVTFQYKDYRLGSLQRTMTLSATEFIRRFLLHVLPKGFQRIRQYGFLANRARAERLDQCRRLLGVSAPVETASATAPVLGGVEVEAGSTQEPVLCPVCRRGYLRRIQEWRRGLSPMLRPTALAVAIDSS
jgi:hypothetical protein